MERKWRASGEEVERTLWLGKLPDRQAAWQTRRFDTRALAIATPLSVVVDMKAPSMPPRTP